MKSTEDVSQEQEDGACPTCGTRAEFRECESCDASGWIIDCGHFAQPRPLAAAADGSGRCLCDECADAKQ